MWRRFREHNLRSIMELSGFWDFAFLDQVDPKTVDIASIEFKDRMAVPGCFDATPAYAGRRGLAAYRVRLPLHPDKRHRLIFNGVNHWCRVYIGGKALREHKGGFTRFAVDFVGQADETEIIVLVDNRFDYDRCPLHLEHMDWYHFGGIARPVELHLLDSLWIEGLNMAIQDFATRTIELIINYGADKTIGPTDLIITCDDQVVLNEKIELTELSGCIQRQLTLSNVSLWSPEEPNLHMLAVQLGQDDMRERIGLRQIRIDGRQILINDRPVRLLGFCRHESHPQFGCGLPEAVLVADIQLLRDMGCNFVRGSHYPQDTRFLDLCDEVGICVWNEAIGWQHSAEQLTDQYFLDAQLAHINEMIAMSSNRPSVIMWGILNESHSYDPQCRPAYEKLLGHLRQLDPTRPVTYACNHPFTDICFDLADIVSINCYPGWYEASKVDIPAELDKIVTYLDAHGQANKPMMISEIGAEALAGWRDWNQDRWSEQYQADLLATAIRHLFFERDRCCGLSIWQFCDCRAAELTKWILGSPRGFNNKGVVDEYRRPKLAYEVIKSLFLRLKKSTNH